MSDEKMLVAAPPPDVKAMYRVGGISAMVLGLAYVVTIPLFAYAGAPPTGGEAWLKYGADRTNVWWVILGLSVLTDFLYVPVGLALYVALQGLNRYAMLIASAFVGLFIVLDLSVTWTNYASLINLSSDYAAAANDAQRAAYVAAAGYPTAVLASRLVAVYAIVDLSFAILVIGFVMLKGVFNKTTAYLGLATGVLGIVSVAGWIVTIIMNAVFATVWVLFVGYRLYRLSQR